MKIINTSDWHLRDKDFEEQSKCCGFIVEYAEKSKPDLIVHSGDVTDSEHLKLNTKSVRLMLKLFKALSDIAPVVVVIGTKSHEDRATMALTSISGKYPIIVSDHPEQMGYRSDNGAYGKWYSVSDNIPGEFDFIISQIPQPTKKYFTNTMAIEDSDEAIQDAMGLMFVGFGNNADKFNCPHIVNMHIQVGGCYISEHQQLIGRDIEVSKNQLSLLRADVICLGHIHKSQEIRSNAFYPGSPTRMNHGETEEKGFYFHTLEPKIHERDCVYGETCYFLESEFIETPARQMFTIKYDFTKDSSDISRLDKILDIYHPVELENAHIKVSLVVWQDEAVNLNESDIEKRFLDSGALAAKVSIMHKPRETVRSSKVCDAVSLPEKLGAMAESRCEAISDEILEKSNQLELNQMGYEEKYKEITSCN